MQAVVMAGGEETGGFVFPEFQNGFDGIFGSAKIIDFLALENVKLSRLYGGMPSLYMAKQSVPLSLEFRGRVMRSLIEDFGDRQIDTIGGIKVFHGDNWILMHHSSEEPVINLYAEAPSKEVANRLIQEFTEKNSCTSNLT